MYCAYVTTIKNIRKHSNADRLQCCEVFGNNVIVDLSYSEGQRVVYFPTDGQLGKEFAEDNNLVRVKDENGNYTGGYLDPDKRNIKAIKLRGEKSEGLILPVSVLAKYTNIEKLKDGDTISTLNGYEICRKYIPRGSRRKISSDVRVAKNKKELKQKVSYPYFEEHIDTEQLAYNQSKFKVGDTCYITLKMHGCFAKGTKIRMANDELRPIEKIKVGDYVLGYNFKTKKVEPTKVIRKFKNSPSNKWNRIKFSRNGLKGEHKCYITSTYNHPFWCEEEQKWIRACDLMVGQKISTLTPTLVLSEHQKEVLLGNYLGDGCLETFTNTSQIETGCKIDYAEYIEYLSNITNGLYKIQPKIYNSGYGTQMLRARTTRNCSIYDYFKDVCNYNNKSKDKLKIGIVNKITPLSLAIFYMDDGSLAHNDYQEDRANFAVCDYSENDCLIIKKCFEKFGINAVIYNDNKGYNRICLNKDAADKFYSIIEKYVPPIMRYKLPEKYRNIEYKPPVFKENSYQSYIFQEQIVQENIKINEYKDEYDMETELHNYIVLNSLVHNTSARTMNAIEETIKKRNKLLSRILKLHDKTTRKYNIISGTRRVTLNNYDGGWYGDNSFREKYHNLFSNKLPKGVEIFYEIVGWINPEKTIMGKCKNKLVKDKSFSEKYGEETVFSYGCNVGENDCYVYRMTITNEDGYTVELPWEQVQIECEKMGVKCVPTLEKFTFTTWEDLMQRVEKYYDGADPIGKTHIREGIVVRIDNRPKFTAYKHKNFNFKVLEGIIKESAEAPDIEEAQEIIDDTKE